VAQDTLRALGALDGQGRVTRRGRAIAQAGTHPRLARALLDGAPLVGTARAAEVVALLAEEGSGGAGDDLPAAVRGRRAEPAGPWRREVRRLTGLAPTCPVTDLPEELAVGLVAGLAYPERLARRRPGGGGYLMASGTAAELAPGTRLTGSQWLAVAAADRAPGVGAAARVRLAAPVDEATARQAGAALLTEEAEVAWVDGEVVARRRQRLGAVTLVERPLPDPDPELLRRALLDGLREAGLGLLTWSREAVELRQRLAFCRAALGEPWPEVAEEVLRETAAEWLAPELARARRRADLARVGVVAALRRLLPWPQAARLDELAPERIEVPSGSRIRVDYSDERAPVLAVKVQEVFGWTEAPRLADGRVPLLLHLLSPAGRPTAVTADLPSFWRTGYPRVRAELRGRYPRHPWPEDPTTAVPTRRAAPRRR
jgi:ATP-dependent helicase HrpB